MILQELKCRGFRCLGEVLFQPGPRVNVIRGDNAQGKTSLLEALLFLATSKSHRTNLETDLRNRNAEGFRLAARVARKDREVSLEANWWQGVKRFKVNGVAQTRVSDILGKVNVVFFAPEDVSLVRGTAAHRRRFLDMELSQLQPAYLRALQQYRQVLRQRNELLRHPSPDAALLDVWDEQLAALGSQLTTDRAAFVEQLAELAPPAYRAIANDEALEVTYRPDIRGDASFAEVLQSVRSTDLKRGVTTRGPHRDDIEFAVAGIPARNFASQGQQRTAALALKLAEMELAHARMGEYPILMLDDVLSELDAHRARRLFEAISPEAQCLLTTTGCLNEDAVAALDCTDFTLVAGRLEKE